MSDGNEPDRDDVTDDVFDVTVSMTSFDEIPASAGDSMIGNFESEAQPQQPVLGDYVLLGKIGAGGMGQVFKAQHRRMDRIVALKLLRPTSTEDEEAVKRFHREVRAAAKLFHPNIVTAFDAGEQDGLHYLVMEYVHGQSLSAVIQQHGPLTLEKATNVILQVATGLEYAHSREVIHRDIKPSNLILADENTVKILDMGLARIGKPSAQDDGTATGKIIGTVSFMSPEQALNSKEVDHRSDVYSLGCTFYALLTGKPPFCGNIVETLLAHAQQPAPSLRDEREDVPERLDQILQKMLAKDPGDRYQTMSELIADLEDCRLPGVMPEPRFNVPSILPSESDVAPRRVEETTPRQPQLVNITAVGIDLGVESSVIAYVDADGDTVTVHNQDDELTTGSSVQIDGMNITVGDNLLNETASSLDNIATDVKRSIGETVYPRAIDGNRFPPEALLALVLSKLADDGRRIIGDWKHAVLSVPNSFDEICRKAVQDAGYIAGLEVVGLVNETMAAALSFAHRKDIDASSAKKLTAEYQF
ncbi:MAG: protein kinase, partial [Planctomycetes bacterium]|nr:protein kinase [Planctomycetota bacterium]